MDANSAQAYDLPERVATYDADMDIMHPLRWKMVEIALEILPFERMQALEVLDLGVGTGVFARRFMETHLRSSVVAIDGASAMLEMAKVRLGALDDRVEWVQSDFREIPADVLKPNRFDIAISSYALHHLNADEKLAVLKLVVNALKPNGWLLNADIVKAKGKKVEQRVQELRVSAVTSRAPEHDERFRTRETTRAFLDKLEANEHDQPQTLDMDLQIIRDAGIRNADVFWKEYREAVIGGPKVADS